MKHEKRLVGHALKTWHVLAGPAWVTGLIVVALFATSKTILSNILGSSRLIFDVACDSGISWLKKLTTVNQNTETPVLAVISITLVVILFSLIGNLKIVASLSNIFAFVLFLAINAALINFRKSHPQGKKAPFRVPGNIKNIPIPTLAAILGLATLLGFNIYNLL